MIEIVADQNDDSEFIGIFENITKYYVKDLAPDEMYSIKIDSWFDYKWRNFQGKVLGAFGVRNEDQLVVPPFIPDRVVEQHFFEKEDCSYIPKEVPALHIYQNSGENVFRRLKGTNRTRLFVWFSGNSKVNSRGSVMIYRIGKESNHTIYISFLKKDEWQIYKTDGISRSEVLSLL